MQRRGSASFGIDREHKRQVDQQAEASQQTVDAATGGGGGGAQGMGSSPATAALAQMESQMLTKFEELERDEQGYSQVNSLFAIIEAMRPLPGRKSIVLFSEGVSIPPAVLRLFTGRHRCGEPRERQHLHDGRRRTACRERAGKNPRPGQRGGKAWSVVLRIVVKRDVGTSR